MTAGVLGGLLPDSHALEVGFSRNAYTVPAGGEVAVAVVVEFGPGEVPDDFFSYGVRLVVSGAGAVGLGSVEVPAELDFTAFAPGATADLSPGVMGVKGNTQFTSGAFQAYRGALLATFTLVGVKAGTVELGLEVFRTVGSSEDVFVSTDGTVLDERITFGSAVLAVVAGPELEIRRLHGGKVRVSYRMVAGLRYFLSRSGDLVDWEVVAESRGGAADAILLEIPTGGVGRAFYRLETAPDDP